MNILNALESQDRFSTTEKEVANYILKKRSQILNMSISQIAKNTYCSKSAIIRMCQKLGFNGFSDFKIEFAIQLEREDINTETTNANFPIKKEDTFLEISKNVSSLMEKSIQDTYKKMTQKEYKQAIDLIQKSQRTAIFGIGDNMTQALSFQNKMAKINCNIIMSYLSNEDAHIASNLTKKDCAIIISYSGQLRYQLYITKILHENNVPIIAITARTESKIGKMASVILELANMESQSIKFSNFSSQTAIELVLNTLYFYYFSLNYDQNAHLRIINETKFLNDR